MGDEAELVERLRRGDEAAFVALIEQHHTALVRLAASFVGSGAVAEEVVQDTWLAVVRGIERFEGRSSFKTWLFRILANRAKTTGARERRAQQSLVGAGGPAVDPSRFGGDGGWVDPPAPWPDDVEDRLVATAMADRIRAGIADLPDAQRQVVTLRDLEGLTAREVCDVLGISEGNQRVLLHRGRSRLRSMLERELGEG